MAAGKFDLNDLDRRMHASIDALKKDLGGLRTGRASVHLLDPVVVTVYGARMPLNQVATVSTPDARMIAVQVWDKSQVSAVEKAIREANLGLNPIPIGSSKSVNLGDTIIIIGFPGLGGSSLTVTRGIHSGIAPPGTFQGDPGTFIKTDTEINRGNSGGTAINSAGELIGVPTAGRIDREAPGKIGLVRPIDEARPLIDKAAR